ncbi:unnamed protein product [Lactuca virosa]|uniref:Uncharacterized protein n=1 Tax=Lactuca virosa TaxID=75947 RepID=A0AAU9NYC5_9ASTR|nr:unnamed protein product [Lactuca virosa]
MDADEKLTELKKAYADMILNTVKEAAGRIMISERKAYRLEFELKESKENALQMLTRLKQMMDSKINEAEMVSQIQQKKIEELEAQVQEAEDIVKDLREELSFMHAELERTKPKNAVNPDSIPTSDVWNSDKDESNTGQTLYNSLIPFWKSYVNDQNLPAIISRSKARKLYRSGCSHRIHACEGTLYEQTNVLKPDLITEMDEESEKLHKEPSLGDERKKDRKRASPDGKKRSQPLDQVDEIDHVTESSYSTMAKSAKCLWEGSGESINTVLDLVRVSDVHRRLREELLPMECEKTELPPTSEAPVDAPELKAVETGGVGVPIHTISGRVIKYTFQRKRKRGTFSTNGSHLGDNMKKKKKEDGNALLETEKVIATEKSTQEETEKVKSIQESTQGENEKVISIEESTKEETYLEKVAKQLI